MKRDASVLILNITILLAAVTGTCLVKPVNAKTITVPDDYPTIQSAIDAANNGDTVFVKSGYYPETLFINKSISLIGEDRNSTIIDAQKTQKQVILVQRDNVVVTNFTLGNNDYHPVTNSGWSQQNGEGDGINILSNAVKIVNNTIIGCPINDINVHFSQYNLITENIIMKSIHGVLVSCVESTITNNIFVNVSYGIEFASYEVRIGVDGGEQSWILSESNIIQGNKNITLSTIPSPFPTPTPTLEPTSEPESLPASLVISSVIAVAVVGLGLIVFFKKRKH